MAGDDVFVGFLLITYANVVMFLATYLFRKAPFAATSVSPRN